MRASMISQWAVFCAAIGVFVGCSLPRNLRDPDWDGRGASDDSSAVETGVVGDDVVTIGDGGGVSDAAADAAPTCTGMPSPPVPLAPAQGAVLVANGATLTVRAPNADRVEFKVADTRDGLTTAIAQSAPVIGGVAELRVALPAARNRGQVWSAVSRCGALATAPALRSFRLGTREPGMWPRNAFEHIELDMNTDGRTDIAYASGEAVNSYGVHASIGGGMIATTTTQSASVGIGNLLDSIYAIGDFHGDGSGDVLVTYPNATTGRVTLFDGGSLGLDAPTVRDGSITYNRSSLSAWVGRAVAALGDINGDGRSDIAIATFESVYIVLGTPKPTGGMPATTLSATAILDVGMSFGGIGSLAAGDFDGDGDVDIAVGAALAAAGAGHVLLFENTNGTFPTAATRDISVAGSALLGAQLIAGAFANDGSIDLVASSLGRSNPLINPVLYVWTRPFTTTVAPLVAAPTAGLTMMTQLGQRLASSGDFDADGFSEIIALAGAYPNGGTSVGLALVFEAASAAAAPTEIGRIVPPATQSYNGALSGCGTFASASSFCVAFSNPSATVGANMNWGEVYLRGYSLVGTTVTPALGATLTPASRNTQYAGRGLCGG